MPPKKIKVPERKLNPYEEKVRAVHFVLDTATAHTRQLLSNDRATRYKAQQELLKIPGQLTTVLKRF